MADKAFTDEELINILHKEGYSTAELEHEGAIFVKVEGRPYMLFNLDDGDLQATYCASGVKITYEDVNTWNRTKRLSRIYIDDDGDVMLEADLLSDGGILEENVVAFFRIFTDIALGFREFLREHDLEE